MEPWAAARRLFLASVAVMLLFAPARPDRADGGFTGLTRAELLVRSVAPAGVPATAEVRRGSSLSSQGRSAMQSHPPGLAILSAVLLLLAAELGHPIRRRRVAPPQAARFPRPQIPRAPPSFRLG